MRRVVYDGILKLAVDETSYSNELDEEIKNNNDKNLCLTLKGYTQNDGLSKLIHEGVGTERLQIEGPLGTGLEIQQTGRHVAFAAGTGILVFIDLVAHLIYRLAGKKLPPHLESSAIDIENFQLVLYTSFVNEKEAIALEMIYALEDMCKKIGKEYIF